ncbi:MAG TPA: sugar phosphate isomerase/epimerase family protein [Bacteroidales bacterium]|nr:sugar phosphate isomerase/epimerase family protein [Bacteroidales bacterium]HQJ82103.1 sugar phosphate isomerase/epimerase family protein [Bacteroidales bacterium]
MQSRRTFIKNSLSAGAGILAVSHLSCGRNEKSSFLNEIGICTGVSNYQILKNAGYSYIEDSVTGFLVPLEEESVFNEKLDILRSSGLPMPALNSFIPGKLRSVGPEAAHDEILEYVETAFRRAGISGVKHIVFGSSGSRKVPEGFSRDEALDQFTALCRKMGPVAEKYDVVVVLEPLNKGECNLLNSVAHGGEIVKAVSHKNIMLLADVYHMLRENESPESIIRYGDYIRHAHIAENRERAAPGTYNEDFRPYLRALKEIDYKGRMSIECNWKNLEEQAGPALEVLRKQIESI